jgi:hypothetical protein
VRARGMCGMCFTKVVSVSIPPHQLSEIRNLKRRLDQPPTKLTGGDSRDNQEDNQAAADACAIGGYTVQSGRCR